MFRIMKAQLRYYFKIDPEKLEEEEVIYMHAELLYVRKLEKEQQEQQQSNPQQ